MVRLVLDPEGPAVAADFKGGTFGRGVWIHPRARCLVSGAKGVTKSLGSSVEVSALYVLLVEAAERRAKALLAAARRAGKLAVGSTAVREAINGETARLLIVATDARAAATTPWVEQAVAAGNTVAWSTKDELGALLGRQEAGVIAVLDDGLKEALERAFEVIHMVPPPLHSHGGASGGQSTEGSDRAEDGST
jgi:ribosomal protein L7Ae-like RNA K-turn-binding protein